MTEHSKKKIAPVVVTAVMLVYYGVYFAVIIKYLPAVWKILLGAVPLLLGAAMVGVCIQRIREIDKGEEDDISQY